jgi:mono/diheme cytochrome c family protein
VLVALWPALVHAQAASDPGQTNVQEEIVQPGAVEAEIAWENKPYEVVDGKVDSGTFNGYRRYQSHCRVCHGPDGLGSSYAPPLIESLAQIGYDGYLEAVMYGIENVSQTEQSVMPAFAEVEEVVNHVDDIYSYLKARADGVIGRGRPERLPD